MEFEFPHRALQEWLWLEEEIHRQETLKPLGLTQEQEEDLLAWAQDEWVRHMDQPPLKISLDLRVDSADEAHRIQTAMEKTAGAAREWYREIITSLFFTLMGYKVIIDKSDEGWKRGSNS